MSVCARINVDDGRTLEVVPGGDEWRAHSAHIRGVVLNRPVRSIAIAALRGFKITGWSAAVVHQAGDEIAERIDVQADDARLSVIVYASGSVSIELRKTGIPRYLAQQNGEKP